MRRRAVKKLAAFALGALLLVSMSPKVVEGARQIRSITNFLVTRTGQFTQAAYKTNNSNTIINLQPSTPGRLVRVSNYNATNGKYVGGTSLNTATRQSFSDNSIAGGYYHLKLASGNPLRPNFRVNGSWSSDSY